MMRKTPTFLMLNDRGFCFWLFYAEYRLRKALIVANDKPSILDDLAGRVRGLIKDLENMVNPQPKRALVPVPVPVRPARPQRPNSYR